MSEEPNVIDYRLGTISRTVRVIAAAPPRLATRVGLGLVLAIDDAYNNDPASELLGLKLGQGARALASTVGSITASVRNGVQSKAKSLNASDGALSKVPALGSAREFIAQAATEAKGTWAAAGYVPVQVGGQPVDEAELPALTTDGPSTSPSVDPVTESEGAL